MIQCVLRTKLLDMDLLPPARRKEIDQKISDLQFLHGTSDVTKLVSASGLDVRLYDFGRGDKPLGAIVSKDMPGFKRETILINERRPMRGRSFTLAHEFGHWVLHNDSKDRVLHRLDYGYGSGHHYPDDRTRIMELEADYFAGALLMPADVIIPAKQFFTIGQIAERLGVSSAKVESRLRWLDRNGD